MNGINELNKFSAWISLNCKHKIVQALRKESWNWETRKEVKFGESQWKSLREIPWNARNHRLIVDRRLQRRQCVTQLGIIYFALIFCSLYKNVLFKKRSKQEGKTACGIFGVNWKKWVELSVVIKKKSCGSSMDVGILPSNFEACKTVLGNI